MRFACLLLFFSTTLWSTERFELEREDGSQLFGFLDVPKEKSFPLAIVIQGAQQESVLSFHEALRDSLLAMNVGLVSLEKQGIKKTGEIDPKEYHRNNSLTQRLDDYTRFINGKKISGWNGKILCVGQGEGGRIAATLAAQNEQCLAMILVSAGGGWSPMEELLYSFRTEMAGSGFSPQYIQSFLVQAKEQLDNALLKPLPELNAFGFSYKYWESLLKTDLPGSLAKSKCPIYYCHGDKDDRIPLESVKALLETQNPKLFVKRYPDSGREIIQNKETYQEAIFWLKEKVAF